MKNAVKYKDLWLTKTSTAFALFQEWKAKDDKVARKKFEDHLKQVTKAYDAATQV